MKRLVGLYLLFLTACSGGIPGNGSLVPDSPPPARLVIGGQEQESGIGSYCWSGSNPEAAICADMIGLPTPRQPLRVEAPFTAGLILPLEEAPTWLSVNWILAEADMRLEFTTPDQLFWHPYGGEELAADMAIENEFEIEAQPGLYLMTVFVGWERHGDVSYGFLVDVTAP